MDVQPIVTPQPFQPTHCFREAILPRPLMTDELYCHRCDKFVSLKGLAEHQREHTLRARLPMFRAGALLVLCLLLTSAGIPY